MKTYKVYVLMTSDGRRYVGMTSLPLSIRCRRTAYNKCPAMENAIAELGWAAFRFETVIDGLTCTEADEREQALIAEYDTTNIERGFNVAHGGIHFKHNEMSKQKISASSTPRSLSFCEAKYSEQAPYKRGVAQFSENGTSIRTFSSIREAAKITGTDPSNIRKCAKGQLKTTNHYMWQFT